MAKVFSYRHLLLWLLVASHLLLGAARPPYAIQEVLDLPDFALIPHSIFEKYDMRSIGDSIAYRIHMKDEGERSAGEPYDFFKEADIQCFFRTVDLDSILAKGFLNQHQVGRSCGSYSPTQRCNAEINLSGLKFEPSYNGAHNNFIHTLRPKYAHVHLSRPMPVGTRSYAPTHYGEIIAVMKDEVKWRTTWTYTDSLSPFSHLAMPLAQLRRQTQGTFYKGYLEFGKHGTYQEAQIFGELDMRDVAYFMVGKTLNSSTAEKLKSVGVPIFRYSIETWHGRQTAIRGELVWEGDPARFAALEASLRASRRGFDGVVRGDPPNLELPKPLPPPEPTVPTYFAGATFEMGFKFKTPSGALYEIVTPAGRAGWAAKLKGTDGKFYALETAIDLSAEKLNAFTAEIEKWRTLESLKIPHARIVESGRDFLVKEWRDGGNGAGWLKGWVAAGSDAKATEALALQAFFKNSAKMGVYLVHLRPKDLMWNGTEWFLIRAGEIRRDLAEEEILARYREKLTERWPKIVPGCASLIAGIAK